MFPFHKFYLKMFHSLDFDVENKLLHELETQWVTKFLTIKRSWIYWLKISLLSFFAIFLLLINTYISFMHFESIFMRIFIPASFLIICWLLLYDTISYLLFYKNNHKKSSIQTDTDMLIRKSRLVNKYFIKFFNLSVFINLFLFFILLEAVIFMIFFYQGDKFYFLILEIVLILFASFLIFKHRILAMNLELDFWLVVPWSFYVINQTGLLSSKQIITAVNIKTIEWVYNNTLQSILWYWDIKIFLEWNIPAAQGIIKLDYIKKPNNIVDLINKVLWIQK